MSSIPVTFDFNGKQYSGHFSQVAGAGSSATFYLTVNGYHWGQLFFSSNKDDGWRFYSSQHAQLTTLSEYFGWVVTAWLDSHS